MIFLHQRVSLPCLNCRSAVCTCALRVGTCHFCHEPVLAGEDYYEQSQIFDTLTVSVFRCEACLQRIDA